MADDLTLGLDLVALCTNNPALLLKKLRDLGKRGLDVSRGRGSGRSRRRGGCGGPDWRGKLLDWGLVRRRGRCLAGGSGRKGCSHRNRGGGSSSGARNLLEGRGLALAWLGVLVVLELVCNSGHGGLLVCHGRRGHTSSGWGRGFHLGHGGLDRRRDGSGRLVIGRNFPGCGTLVDALHVDLGRDAVLAVKPLLGGHGGLEAGRRGVDVGLEGLGTTGNGEGDGLDVLIVDGLVGPHDFVLVDVDTTARHKSNTSLGVARLVFGQELQLVVLVLEITNVAITADVSMLSTVPISGCDKLTPCQQGTGS